MSPHERRALMVVLALGVGGHLLRAAVAEPGDVGAVPVLLDPANDGDPLAHRDLSDSLARPLAPGERIDIDRADARELQRLPGVGPALAGRIVADRKNNGAFGNLAGLDRVSGIGPATLERLAPTLTFSGRSTEASSVTLDPRLAINQAGVSDLLALPGIGASRARAIVAFRDSAGPFRDVADLKRVPGLPDALVDRLAPRLRLH